MGREGIKNKDMFFIPPFGAIARVKEMWPSRGAESRISLAGPAFGLISLLMFAFFWVLSRSALFLASMVLASYINLFNLLFPVPIMDGGRVVKSILFSFSNRLGKSFYLLGLALLAFLALTSRTNPFLVILIGYMLWSEYTSLLSAEKALLQITNSIEQTEQTESALRQNGLDKFVDSITELKLTSLGFSSIDEMKKRKEGLELLLNPPPMDKKEIATSILLFIAIARIYIFSISFIGNSMDINLRALPGYFK